MPQTSRRNRMNRCVQRRFLVGLLTGATSLVVLPMAIAWACAPSTGQIEFNKDSYSPGETVAVWGSGFADNNPVVLTLQPPSGAAQQVAPEAATDDNGYFETSFALPPGAVPGSYAVQARTDEPGIGPGHPPTRPTTATWTFEVPGPPAPAAPAPAPAPAPALVIPRTEPVVNNRAMRIRAVRTCKRRYTARRSAPLSKRRAVKRKRGACIRRARARFPMAPSR